ncbi:polyhydroxybutyrate depolymerase [Yoonia sp. GPGPB17]|uniref:alpha/beta hydrolase family esterase n=1 Tax=Yoonia sp. GPGPB17 TaxID=3026147 RepID=UPI0030BE04DE
MTHSWRHTAAILLAASWLPTHGLAQDCGSADDPCTVTGGSYHMVLPETETPTGIVIHLHGGGGTGKGQMNSGLAGEAIARGYVFVAPNPNGEHPENRWSKDWSVRADNMSFERDDIAFLTDVLIDARQRSGASEGPVLLAGFSRGGSMVWNVACYQPDFGTAYAPLAGAFWDTLPSECGAPVRLFYTHGWADRKVPLEGRSFSDGAVVQGDVWASLKVLRETNGCPPFTLKL